MNYLVVMLIALTIIDLLTRVIQLVVKKLIEVDEDRLNKLQDKKDKLKKREELELLDLQKKLGFRKVVVSLPLIGLFMALRNFIRDHFSVSHTYYLISYMVIKILVTTSISALITFIQRIDYSNRWVS